MSRPTKWACDVCDTEYASQAAAEACEEMPFPEKTADVGDIVLVGRGFGWNDGDDKWIAPEKKGSSVRTFYYVVTAVDREPRSNALHRWRYHLATLAMSGSSGYRIGYTFDVGHYKPERVASPPEAVVAASKALLGKKATSLI